MNSLKKISSDFDKSLKGIKTKLKETSAKDLTKYAAGVLLASTLSTGVQGAELDGAFADNINPSQATEMTTTKQISNVFDQSIQGKGLEITEAKNKSTINILSSSCESGAFYNHDAEVLKASQKYSSIDSGVIGYDIRDEIALYQGSDRVEKLVDFANSYGDFYKSMTEEERQGYSELGVDDTGYTYEVINQLRQEFNYDPNEGLSSLESKINYDNEFIEKTLEYQDTLNYAISGEVIPSNFLSAYAEDIYGTAKSLRIDNSEILACSKEEYDQKLLEDAKLSVGKLAYAASSDEGEGYINFIDEHRANGVSQDDQSMSKTDAMKIIHDELQKDSTPDEIKNDAENAYDNTNLKSKFSLRAKGPTFI